MYRLNYQFTHDIDWFCRINGIPVHLASNGGVLPWNSYSIRNLVKLQHRVARLEPSFRCSFNVEYVSRYLQQGEFYDSFNNLSDNMFRQMLPEGFMISDDVAELPLQLLVYGWSFIEMARRGFFSFDRKEGDDSTYHLVAWPTEFDCTVFNGEVYNTLKRYNACCFPPIHKDYKADVPECIKFDVDSCHSLYGVE